MSLNNRDRLQAKIKVGPTCLGLVVTLADPTGRAGASTADADA